MKTKTPTDTVKSAQKPKRTERCYYLYEGGISNFFPPATQTKTTKENKIEFDLLKWMGFSQSSR